MSAEEEQAAQLRECWQQQRDEIEALESIYEQAFQLLHAPESAPPTDDKKDKHVDTKFRILLHPYNNNEAANHVALTLEFTYPPLYPASAAPTVKLVSVANKQLSGDAMTDIQQSLETGMKELLGDVMVFELAQGVQTIMRQNNVERKSFYEEMMERQKKEMLEEKSSKSSQSKSTGSAATSAAASNHSGRSGAKPAAFATPKLAPLVVPPSLMGADDTLAQLDDGDQQHGSRNNNNDSNSDNKQFVLQAEIEEQQRKLLELMQTYDKENDDEDNDDDALLSSLRPPVLQRLGTVAHSDLFSHRALDDDVQQVPPQPQRTPSASLTGTTPSSSTSSEVKQSFFGRPSERLSSDFLELGKLGKGGFGEVVKVRNKIDGLVYAVKKIKLPRNKPKLLLEVKKEVQVIARLHHDYIVRYYTAWIETDDLSNSATLESKEGGASSDSQRAKTTSGSTTSTSRNEIKFAERKSNNDDDDDGAGVVGEDDSFGLSYEYSAGIDTSSFGEQSKWFVGDSDDEDEDGDDTDEDEESDGDEDELSDFGGLTRTFSYYLNSQKFNKNLQKQQQSQQSSSRRQQHQHGSTTTGTDDDDDDGGGGQVDHLYILMEFCARQTLKNVIEEGKIFQNPNAAFRLFRQMVEAMVYIHGKGVIHRDLKPDNVFIDAQGNVKLGDFGLAVEETDTTNKKQAITEVVGTTFYRSPEQETPGVEYDNKADMYALGIILFEMMYPFDTLMERAIHLSNLRKEGTPEALIVKLKETETLLKQQKQQKPTKQQQKNNDLVQKAIHIITMLLKTHPVDRPSADELLSLLPVQIEDSYMQVAILAASDRSSNLHGRMVDALFRVPPPSASEDFVFDFQPGTQQRFPHAVQAHVQTQMQLELTRVFRRAGAVCMESQLLIPSHTHVLEKNAAEVIGQSGLVLRLPHSLTFPFARSVAQNSVFATGQTVLKRYDISKVYRKARLEKKPRELWEAAVDVVWEDPQETLRRDIIFELELIRTCVVAMNRYKHVFAPFTLHINHIMLLQAMLGDVLSIDKKAPASSQRGIQESIIRTVAEQKGQKKPWRKYSKYFQQSDGLRRFLSYIGSMNKPEHMWKQLKKLFRGKNKHVDHLKQLCSSLKEARINIPIVIDCGLVCNNVCFRSTGLMGQIVSHEHGVICELGRYDSVINTYFSASVVARRSGMGAVFNLQKMLQVVSKWTLDLQERAFKAKLNRSNNKKSTIASLACDDLGVLVCSSSDNSFLQRYQVATKLLYREDFRVEFTYPSTVTVHTAKHYARQIGLRWVVSVGTRLYEKQKFVKILDTKHEHASHHHHHHSSLAHSSGDSGGWREIHVDELAATINNAVASASSGSGSTPSATTTSNIRILDPRNTVKNSRKHVLATAKDIMGPFLQSNSNSLIVAIDLNIQGVRDVITSMHQQKRTDSGKDRDKDGWSFMMNHLHEFLEEQKHMKQCVFVYAIPSKKFDMIYF